MKKLILTALLVAASTMMMAQVESFRDLINKGINAQELNLYDRAETYYRQAFQIAPDSAEALFRLAMLQESGEFHYSALENFNTGLLVISSLESSGGQIDLATVYEHMAYCAAEVKDFDVVNKYAQLAIESNPSSASAMASFALFYNHQENYMNALSWANKAIAAVPKYARGYNVLGIINYSKGDDAEAIKNFRKAMQLDPKNVDAYYNLATMYCVRNNFESALTTAKKGIQIAPKSPRLYNVLAWAYRLKGENEKAIQSYKQVLELDSNNVDALNMMGVIYTMRGDFELAQSCHRKAIKKAPNNPDSYKWMGKSFCEQGNYNKALSFFQKATLISKDHETYLMIAEMYGRQHNSAKESSFYKKAAKAGNKTAQAWLTKRGMAW